MVEEVEEEIVEEVVEEEKIVEKEVKEETKSGKSLHTVFYSSDLCRIKKWSKCKFVYFLVIWNKNSFI